MNVVELFAGGGGAALGLRAAGWEHGACIDNDATACLTLRQAGFRALELDLLDRTIPKPPAGVPLIWASPPCQPYSTAGSRKGGSNDWHENPKNLWPHTLEWVRACDPEWFVFENVPGLLEHGPKCAKECVGFDGCPAAYFMICIMEALEEQFDWVGAQILNAADYGLPQRRRRLFVVAGPYDIPMPEPTHTKNPDQLDLFGPKKPWVTVQDALGVEGFLSTGRKPGRERIVPTSEPSPTVTASGNLLFQAKGSHSRARLGVNQVAALQGFPETHKFKGNITQQFRQIGNAVPPELARIVGAAILRARAH